MTYEFKALDYIILSFVLIVSIGIGLYEVIKKYIAKLLRYFRKVSINDTTKTVNEVNEYLVASSSMSAFPISLSLLASFFSATSLLGTPAEIYEYGIQFWISLFGTAVTPLFAAFATGPFFARLKILSLFEYLKLRYNTNFMRMIGVTCYLIRSFISCAIFIYGPVTILIQYINLGKIGTVILIGAIGTFYTTIGGIKAVIFADAFQILIMLASMIAIAIKGTIDVAGISELWRINGDGKRLNFFDFDINPFIRQSFWSLIIGSIVRSTGPYCIDQQVVQRFAAAKNKRTAQIALLLNVPGVVLFATLCCYCGLVIFAHYATCDPLSRSKITGVTDPNQLMSFFVSEKMINIWGFNGLFISSILCGSLSSVSSTLNSQSAILLEDFLKRFSYVKNLNDRKLAILAQLLVIFAGLISTVLALLVASIDANLIQISITLNGVFGAPITTLFLLGCLIRK